LVSWTLDLPLVRGLGPARRGWQIHRPVGAGHAEISAATLLSTTGPTAADAGQALGPPQGPMTPWTPARARFAEIIAQAHAHAERLRRESTLTQAQLGAEEGCSAARINQRLAFLRLDPAILADLSDMSRHTPVPAVPALRALMKLPPGPAQVARYRALCGRLVGGGAAARAEQANQRGFQHLLCQARTWSDELAAGTFRTVAELARARRLPACRVSQLLLLLTLPPDLLKAVDVPAAALPSGLTQKDLRELARLRDPAAQRARFAERWGPAAGRACAK
jgi:hypothetical protein